MSVCSAASYIPWAYFSVWFPFVGRQHILCRYPEVVEPAKCIEMSANIFFHRLNTTMLWDIVDTRTKPYP